MNHSTLFLHTEDHNCFLGHKNQISLDMTEAEYDNALRDACYGNLSKEGRIIVHEYAHWVQSAGTPYGFYLELVHHYESQLLQQMEELIADRLYEKNGMKVSPPFKKYIENPLFYHIQDETLWGMFEDWLDLYFLIQVTEERRDDYYNMVNQYKDFFLAYPECKHTQDIENYSFLPRLFSRADRFLDRQLSEFIGRDVPAKDISTEELYSRKNMKAAMASGLNGMSLQITHHSLWESYATVVEYMDVPEEFTFPSEFGFCSKQKSLDEYYDPLRYLEVYLPSLKYDKSLFLQSCACLFDIVFSPPILPQCEPFRESALSMFDFDIISRFYAVAEAAKCVGLLSNYPSVGAYMTAICRVLNWRTPDEIFFQLWRCWDSLNVIPTGKTFQCFISMRVSGEYLVWNRIRFLNEVRAGNVNPCFLRLKDRTITNTSFSYNQFAETGMELLMNSLFFQQEPLFPEPLRYDDAYYEYYLLQELVEKLWEEDSKVIALTVPKECNCCETVKDYLQSWVDAHHIDARCDVKMA